MEENRASATPKSNKQKFQLFGFVMACLPACAHGPPSRARQHPLRRRPTASAAAVVYAFIMHEDVADQLNLAMLAVNTVLASMMLAEAYIKRAGSLKPKCAAAAALGGRGGG